MSNAENVRRYNERKRAAGFVRVDCLLTPQAHQLLMEYAQDGENWGATMSRLIMDYRELVGD